MGGKERGRRKRMGERVNFNEGDWIGKSNRDEKEKEGRQRKSKRKAR